MENNAMIRIHVPIWGVAHMDTRINCLTWSPTIRDLVSRVSKRSVWHKWQKMIALSDQNDMHT